MATTSIDPAVWGKLQEALGHVHAAAGDLNTLDWWGHRATVRAVGHLEDVRRLLGEVALDLSNVEDDLREREGWARLALATDPRTAEQIRRERGLS